MSALSDALNEANTEGWSAREIARRSGDKVSHSVVADYLKGREAKRPKEYVLAAFAEVFPSLSVSKLRQLAGLPAGRDERWTPPDEVHQLTEREQRALSELIRAIAAGKREGEGDDRDAAPIVRDQGYDVAVRTPSGHLQRIELKAGSGKTASFIALVERMKRQAPTGYQIITVAHGEVPGPALDWDAFLAEVVEDHAARPSTTD